MSQQNVFFIIWINIYAFLIYYLTTVLQWPLMVAEETLVITFSFYFNKPVSWWLELTKFLNSIITSKVIYNTHFCTSLVTGAWKT